MAAALPARHLSSFTQDRRDARARRGRAAREPQLRAGVHAVRAWRRPRDSGPGVPVRVHHDHGGAISGFQLSLIASGTTPKMVERRRDMLPVAYGPCCSRASVGIIAARRPACSLSLPTTSRSTRAEVFAKLGMALVHLQALSAQVGENITGRRAARCRSPWAWRRSSRSCPRSAGSPAWYHFVIMFEAMFVMTLIDTGTRVTRYMFRVGSVWRFRNFAAGRASRPRRCSAALSVCAWGYFIVDGHGDHRVAVARRGEPAASPPSRSRSRRRGW